MSENENETPEVREAPKQEPPGISVADLAFVLEVLVPRVWVRGREVDGLVELRHKLEVILERVGRDAPA